MNSITAFAPAKINLFLHVGAVGPDGYHPISSWMAFADFGDHVEVECAEIDSFDVDGPFAAGVPVDDSNLVLKARNAVRRSEDRHAIRLIKRLPPASGLGGGSSDAAATLRALAELHHLPFDALSAVAPALGADVPACLSARSLLASGRGEVLATAPCAPDLHAVLVNPGVETSTGRVFKAYDAGPIADHGLPDLPGAFDDLETLIDVLRSTRNDLEAPARALHPEIGAVLTALGSQPESGFVRMSGSGATCFALCRTEADAQRLGDWIEMKYPTWWVQNCRLITSV